MKTALNITRKQLSNIEECCEKSLIEEILEDFCQNGQIIVSEQLEIGERVWDISHYVTPNTLCDKRKLAVILSYADYGYVKYENWKNWGTTNAIIELYKLGCMSDDDFDYFVEKFYNFCNQSGDTSKFK